MRVFQTTSALAVLAVTCSILLLACMPHTHQTNIFTTQVS